MRGAFAAARSCAVAAQGAANIACADGAEQGGTATRARPLIARALSFARRSGPERRAGKAQLQRCSCSLIGSPASPQVWMLPSHSMRPPPIALPLPS